MIRYIVFNDPHLDINPPSSRRVDAYYDVCFDKLNQILQLAKDNNSDFLICTGDWFHKKAPTKVPYELTVRLLNWLDMLSTVGDTGIKLFTVAGNHDTRYQDTTPEGLRAQPFGVIAKHDRCSVLQRGDARIFIDYESKSEEHPRLWVTGNPYLPAVYNNGEPSEDITQFYGYTYSEIRPQDFHIHIVHAAVMGEVPTWRPYTLVSDVFANTRADIVHSGHVHDDVGIYKGTNTLGRDCYFTNIGSITRGSLNEQNISREPSVLSVDIDLDTRIVHTQRIPLKCAPASEIYDLEAYRNRKQKKVEVSTWAARVRTEISGAQAEDETLETLIEASSLDHRSRAIARDIANEVGE